MKLSEIIKKHLPPEKIRSGFKSDDRQDYLDAEKKLLEKHIVNFVKENKKTFEKITASLASGDVKTAHRTAHTLKSIAGYIGRKGLQEAAFSLEKSLQNGTADYTTEQLYILEKELSFALREFEPLVIKSEIAQIVEEDLTDLFEELKLLLKNGEFDALNFVEKLRGIKDMDELADRIEDYDFTGALEILDSLDKTK